MRHTSVDHRSHLVLCLVVGVQNVVRHIHNLEHFVHLLILVVSFDFELNKLSLVRATDIVYLENVVL